MQPLLKEHFYQADLIIRNSQSNKDGLFSGNLGLSLYYLNLYLAFGKEADAAKSVEYVEQILTKINENSIDLMGNSICNGAAGLAMMILFLEREALVNLEEEDQILLDTYLFESTRNALQHTNEHDYLHGAMGVIHYFLERLPDPAVASFVYELIEIFCDKAVYTVKGIWFKNKVVPDDNENEINFGLSHGQAGFLILLANAWEKGIEIEIIPLLLNEGVELMLQYKREPPADEQQFSLFPTSVYKKNFHYSSRLGWCYGDLDIALAIYKVGKLMGNDFYLDQANEIIDNCMKRKCEQSTAIVDSHICHGSTGLAQMYKSIYDQTQEEKHKEAWQYWMGQTVNQLLPKELATDFYKNRECDFLEGLVGVNLALLSAITEKELNWQKILLL
jgi:lantibiotic modifying enzyme